MSKYPHNVQVRLDDAQYGFLKRMADFKGGPGSSVSDQAREAIQRYMEAVGDPHAIEQRMDSLKQEWEQLNNLLPDARRQAVEMEEKAAATREERARAEAPPLEDVANHFAEVWVKNRYPAQDDILLGWFNKDLLKSDFPDLRLNGIQYQNLEDILIQRVKELREEQDVGGEVG